MTKYRVTDDTSFTAAVLAESEDEAKQLCVTALNDHKTDSAPPVEKMLTFEVVKFGFEVPHDNLLENYTESIVIDMRYLDGTKENVVKYEAPEISNAFLSSLSIGSLDFGTFDKGIFSYNTEQTSVKSATISAVPGNENFVITITLNGTTVDNNSELEWQEGDNVIEVSVKSHDLTLYKDGVYEITVPYEAPINE